MSLEIIDGDLLTFKAEAILHQTNCVTRNVHGLCRYIADTYTDPQSFLSKLPSQPHPAKMGTFKLVDTEESTIPSPYVVNLYAQVYPGKPGYGVDSEQARLRAFQEGLHSVQNHHNFKTLALPFMIGCGLAGGSWENYLSIIENFASENKETLKVYLIRKSN